MVQRSKRRIAIACQGGGSHTAFTAGALREILEEVKDKGRYEIVALSGTSGGALCAFLAWYVLLKENSEQDAMKTLRSFWEEDNAAYLRVGDPQSLLDVAANDLLTAEPNIRSRWQWRSRHVRTNGPRSSAADTCSTDKVPQW